MAVNLIRRALPGAVIVLVGLVALLPLVQGATGALPWLAPNVLAAVNLIGWSVALALWIMRMQLGRRVGQVAAPFGIETRFTSVEQSLGEVTAELDRKNAALSMNLIERRLTSKEELSRALEQIVALAYRLLDGESAELALYDKESGLYHSSFVLGKPFRSSAQAMLAGELDESGPARISPDVLVHPVSFAGAVLGSLRVALPKGTLPTPTDREVVRLLSLQASLAMVNAQYNEELLRMKRVSEESVKAKTGFLANLSHELRGPLGIMLNAVELVLDGLCGSVSADQLETLQMVRSNGEHLLELINDVLDYAKIESGRVTPQKVPLAADDLLQDICNVVRAQAEAKKHRLISIRSDAALTFACDRRHARQMLINVLTNAIKYTPDGGTIEVWGERVPGNRIKLNVRDSGVGIESNQRHRVFAAFERIEHSYSLQQMGTGLGMPLTRRLAELNGGLIDFESTPGRGSHFWLVFGASDPEPQILTESAPVDAAPVGRGEVVLLLHREDGERAISARYLQHLGFTVLTAASRQEGFEVLRERSADLVLVDNTILESGEDDLVAMIRAAGRSVSLPVVLQSSRAFVFDVEKYLRAGFDRCLSKPLSLQSLARACREVLDSRQVQPAAGGKGEGAPPRRGSALDDILH